MNMNELWTLLIPIPSPTVRNSSPSFEVNLFLIAENTLKSIKITLNFHAQRQQHPVLCDE